jgi:hypothetical protein
MKILCSLSSIEFDCEHFPGTFYSREVYHPIFSLPQKRLLSYTGKWAAGELTLTDSYLLFLAILKTSDQVDFRVPATRAPKTDSIIANNMEYLVRTIIKLNTVRTPTVVFPSFVISPETKDLGNVRYWIENWEFAYRQFQEGYRSAHESAKLIRRESALQRMIKNPHKQIHEYANQLADWAATAGNFPTFKVTTTFSKTPITCAEYWKILIHKSAKQESLYAIPKSDLKELLDHCEDNIPVGSIYSHALFKLLRTALEKQENFLGLGDMDVRSVYTLLESTEDVETANMRALLQSAPEEEPRQDQYPTKFEFMRAKMRWDMKRKFGPKNDGTESKEFV